MHGWGCNKSVFQTLSNILSCSGKRVIAVDLPGFGQSDPPQPYYSVTDYAERVYSFATGIGLTKFAVIGHSFGGRVAIKLCAMHPDCVDKLVLMGSAGLRRFSFSRILRVLKYKFVKLACKLGLIDKAQLNKYGSSDFKSLKPSLRGVFARTIKEKLDVYAKRIVQPTLLLWGRYDKETPLWMGKKYRRLIKNSALITLDGGHFLFAEKPNLVGRILNAFLTN